MTAATKPDQPIEEELAKEKERSDALGERLDDLAKKVAPKKPGGDDTWKGDVA